MDILHIVVKFYIYRYAARRVKEKKSLGESTNVIEYLSNRLNWDDAAKERAIRCYPPLSQCSILKVRLENFCYLNSWLQFKIKSFTSNYVAHSGRNVGKHDSLTHIEVCTNLCSCI